MQVTRSEFVLLWATYLAVMWGGLQAGIGAGIVLSTLYFAWAYARVSCPALASILGPAKTATTLLCAYSLTPLLLRMALALCRCASQHPALWRPKHLTASQLPSSKTWTLGTGARAHLQGGAREIRRGAQPGRGRRAGAVQHAHGRRVPDGLHLLRQLRVHL